MYEFYKNNKGEDIEGYLGDPEEFNGIVFLLKEPNNPDGADEFWFKNMLESKDKYLKESPKSRSIFSKFKNRFSEMIMYTENKNELKNSIFCNLHPVNGKTTASEEFHEILLSNKPEMMLEFFSTLKETVTVFTCKDIYRRLVKSDKINITNKKIGLRYKNETLNCFECEINNSKIVVYEICHPSRSSKIQG